MAAVLHPAVLEKHTSPVTRVKWIVRQRYFFTAEIAENAENGELLWALLSRSPFVFLPFPCFLPRALSRTTTRARIGVCVGRR